MKIIKLFLFVVFMNFCFGIYAQFSNSDPSLYDYSNNEINATLVEPGTFAGYPYTSSPGGFYGGKMDLYSGTNNILFPIWTIGVPGISVDVSIGYCASGIKTDQLASNVGLGWSLNAGGCIKRLTRGYPDDSHPSYMGWVKEAIQIGSSQTSGELSNSFSPTNNPPLYFARDQLGLLLGFPETGSNPFGSDTEPDIYIIECPNIGGSFMFTGELENGDEQKPVIVSLNKSNNRIVVNYDSDGYFDSFVVTDELGNKYTFSTKEYVDTWIVTHHDANGQPTGYFKANFTTGATLNKNNVTAWFLDKIESPSGELVNFTYEKEQFIPDQTSSHYVRNDQPDNKKGHDNSVPFNSNSNIINTWRIKSIFTTTAKIDFLALTTREDINQYSTTNNCKRVDAINIYSTIQNNSVLIRSFELLYNYFSNDNCPNFGGAVSVFQPGADKRLKLLSIQESCRNKVYPPTKFHYWSNCIPNRFSYATDVWGYYNNKTTNTTGLPRLYIYPELLNNGYSTQDIYRTLPLDNYTPYAISGCMDYANRLPDEEFIKIGMLEKIEYPEGYTDVFDYEPHSFYYKGKGPYNGGGLRLKQKTSFANNIPVFKEEYKYQLEDGTSSGLVLNLPTYGYYDPTPDIFNYNTELRHKKSYVLTSFDVSGNSSQVGYSRVEVIQNEGTGYKGKTIHTFKNPQDPGSLVSFYEQFPTYLIERWDYPQILPLQFDINTQNNYYPYPPAVNVGWLYGQPERVVVLDKYGNKVNETEFFYELTPSIPQYVYGIKIGFLENSAGSHYPINAVAKYKIHYGISYRINKVTEKSFKENNFLSATTLLSYNNFNQISSSITTNSDGTIFEKRNKYPMDYSFGYSPTGDAGIAISQMKQKNIIAIPLESILLKAENTTAERFIINGQLSEYKCETVNGINHVPLLKYNFEFQAAIPVSTSSGSVPFLPSSINATDGFVKDPRYVKTKSVDKYNDLGRATELHAEYEPVTSMIYCPYTKAPIATAYNATANKIYYSGFEFDNTVSSDFVAGFVYSDAFAGSYVGKSSGGSIGTPSFSKTVLTGVLNGSSGFKASVWVKGPSNSCLSLKTVGGTPITKSTYNSNSTSAWNLLSIELTASELSTINANGLIVGVSGGTVSSPAYFDELKLYPLDATLSTVSTDYAGRTVSVGDANDQYTFNEYDDLGNLLTIKDNNKDIIKVTDIQFGHPALFNVYDSDYGEINISSGVMVAANKHGDGSVFTLIIKNGGTTVYSSTNNTGLFTNPFSSPGEYLLTLYYSNDNTPVTSYSKTIIVKN